MVAVKTVITLRFCSISVSGNDFAQLCRSERRHGRVVRAARLWCRKSPEGCEFEDGLRHPTMKILSVNPAVNGHHFRIRKG